MNFLDKTGLVYLWSKIKTYLNSVLEAKSNKVLWSQTLEEITAAGTFDNQNVALDLSNYKRVAISCYKNYTNSDNLLTVTQIFKITSKGEISIVDYFNGTRAWVRTVNVKTDGIYFFTATLNGTENNTYLVPYEVVGLN